MLMLSCIFKLNNYQLPFRKFNTYIPFVPTKEEITGYFSDIPDLKEKTMLVLMYSSGLRLGEVCSLRYEDIDRKKMRIYIRFAKNRARFHKYGSIPMGIFQSYIISPVFRKRLPMPSLTVKQESWDTISANALTAGIWKFTTIPAGIGTALTVRPC